MSSSARLPASSCSLPKMKSTPSLSSFQERRDFHFSRAISFLALFATRYILPVVFPNRLHFGLQPLNSFLTLLQTSETLYQEDLYPPCPSGKPALTPEEWLAGKNAPPATVNLKPQGVTSVFEVAMSQGG